MSGTLTSVRAAHHLHHQHPKTLADGLTLGRACLVSEMSSGAMNTMRRAKDHTSPQLALTNHLQSIRRARTPARPRLERRGSEDEPGAPDIRVGVSFQHEGGHAEHRAGLQWRGAPAAGLLLSTCEVALRLRSWQGCVVPTLRAEGLRCSERTPSANGQ